MRQVKVFKYQKAKHEDGTSYLEKVFDYIGKFHQFGVEYEEFETGAGNYSTAIVEKDNGKVENVFVGNIQFID